MTRKRVAVLISGRGSNMAAIARACASGSLPAQVAVVIADRTDAPGLALARDLGLATAIVPFGGAIGRQAAEHSLAQVLDAHRVDLIVLAGFMRILSPWFVGEWQGRIVNIHPSLLPKYRGLDTHARAIEAGDLVSGCSVHVVTEELDAGEVLGQVEVPIEPGDTPATLEQRVLAAEHRLYPQVLGEFVNR